MAGVLSPALETPPSPLPPTSSPTAPSAPPSPDRPTVSDAVRWFLAEAASRLKDLTVGQYAADLRLFRRTFGDTPVAEVNALRITRWLGEMTCGPTTKGVRLRSVSAFFGWAVGAGLLIANPIRSVAKPRERSRGASALISPETHQRLLAGATPYFGAVLQVLHGTGCRPGEAARITASVLGDGVAVLHEHKTDSTGRPRVIVLPPAVAVMLEGLAEMRHEGELLRTHQGNPWTGRSITEAMVKLTKKLGLKATAYGYRHTFATDALEAGVPDATVAALIGHSSTAMLFKHYSHLTSRIGALKAAAERVRGREAPPPPSPPPNG